MCTLNVWLTGDTTPQELNVAKKHGNLAKRFPRSRIYGLLLILLFDMYIQFYADIHLSKCNYHCGFIFCILLYLFWSLWCPQIVDRCSHRDVEVLLSFSLLKMTLKVLWMFLGLQIEATKKESCTRRPAYGTLQSHNPQFPFLSCGSLLELCGNPPQNFHHWTHLSG